MYDYATTQELRPQTECTCTKPETAADDGPDVDTSTPPIPPESVARKRSADVSCMPQAHLLQRGQRIRAAVASPPRSPVHRSPSSSCPSPQCGASVSHSRSWTSLLTGPAAAQSISAAEFS